MTHTNSKNCCIAACLFCTESRGVIDVVLSSKPGYCLPTLDCEPLQPPPQPHCSSLLAHSSGRSPMRLPCRRTVTLCCECARLLQPLHCSSPAAHSSGH